MTSLINDLNYERVLIDAFNPVLLVFRASFCGPSAAMEPALDDLYLDFKGDVAIMYVDVETCPNLTRVMQVKGTPCMILVKKGEPVASRMGTSSYDDLVEWLEKNLAK